MDQGSVASRILIAYRQPMFLDGLRMLLEAEQHYRVVGGTANSADVVKLVCHLKPDILLLDSGMVEQPYADALHDIARLPAKPRILLLVSAIQKSQIVEAFKLGVCGVLLNDSTTQLLRESIRSLVAGQYWLGRESVSDLVEALCGSLSSNGGNNHRKKMFGLTARELEIVDTVVAGYTNNEIAQKFSLSKQTVKNHLGNIFDKVGVSNRLELALFSVHHQLLGS